MDANTGILVEGLGLQAAVPPAMGALGVMNVPNAGYDQSNQRTDAPGRAGRKQGNANQADNAAEENTYLLQDDGNFTDHHVLLFSDSFTTSQTCNTSP